MRVALCFLLCTLAVVLAVPFPDEKYTTKYDNIDVDQILKSNRLLSNYHKCLMDKGPCAPDAAELKKVLHEALETECSKCTEKQKEITQKVIKHLVNHRPELWQELVDKYDPEKKYRVKFEKQAKDAGIAIPSKR